MFSISSSSSSSQHCPMDVVIADIRLDPYDVLPVEIYLEILSHLSLSELGTMALVSKKWKDLARDPVLEREFIYRTIAFGSEKWEKYFGAVVDKTTVKSLPLNIGATLRSICLEIPDATAQKSLMLFWKPKTINGENLTIKSIGRLVHSKFPKTEAGYDYIWDEIVAKHGDTPNNESHWVLLTTDVLPGSRGLSYAKQQQLVAALAARTNMAWEVPDALSAITCIFAKYLSSGTMIFSWDRLTFTRCQDNIEGYQVVVGSFTPSLSVYYCDSSDDRLGVAAALRKF